jgi:ATP synthase protein I
VRKNSETTSESREAAFGRKVGALETRKLRAKRRGVQDIWFGLGMFGLIGWAVAIPSLLGVLLGVFIDSRYPGTHSWTLSLLVIGLFIGCLNAWRWVANEEKAIREDEEKKDE